MLKVNLFLASLAENEVETVKCESEQKTFD